MQLDNETCYLNIAVLMHVFIKVKNVYVVKNNYFIYVKALGWLLNTLKIG